MYKRKIKLDKLALPIGFFIAVILFWELIDFFLEIQKVILPNPHEIFFALVKNIYTLIQNTTITMFEAVLGFIMGSSIGFILALLFVYSAKSKRALYPYVIALKATPVIVLAPLLNLWLGTGISSKVFMASLIVFFPVLISSVKGLTAIDEESLDLFKSLNSSKFQIFTKLRFPNSLPYIFPSLKIATTFSIVGAIIAEFTGASQGIGYVIINSSYYLETSTTFASIVMISSAGILFFYAIDFLEKKIIFWQRSE